MLDSLPAAVASNQNVIFSLKNAEQVFVSDGSKLIADFAPALTVSSRGPANKDRLLICPDTMADIEQSQEENPGFDMHTSDKGSKSTDLKASFVFSGDFLFLPTNSQSASGSTNLPIWEKSGDSYDLIPTRSG